MIAHNKPWITTADQQAVQRVLESGQIADFSETSRLTKALLALSGNKGACCLTHSGTAAIFLVLKVLDLAPGSLVAVPTYACRALLDAVLLANLQPVIADICDDLTMDPDSLKQLSAAIGTISATIAVHTFGAMADTAALQEYGGTVIEDCCHSIGGKHVTGGPIQTFSFYATKVITGGQGGALWCNDRELIDKANQYLEKNIRPGHYSEGFNFRTTDLQSALLLSQLSRIDTIFTTRSCIAQRYHAALPGTLRSINPSFDAGRMYYRFAIRFPTTTERDRAFDLFTANQVETSKLFRQEELLHHAYRRHLPGYYADGITERLLSIPIYPALAAGEIDHIETLLRSL